MGLDITGLGSVADFAGTLVDKFLPSKATAKEKNDFKLGIETALATRDAAKRDVIVAEMNQDDKFTKRARPMLVYMGLAFIGLTEIVVPVGAWIASIFIKDCPSVPDLSLPTHFWMAWGGTCSIWSIGRSAEKRGVASGALGKAVSLITGR